MTLTTETIVDPAGLAGLAERWDALAVECRQPMSAPAWMLGWLRHASPPATSISVVVVRDRETVVGLAPFFVQAQRSARIDYRLMGEAYPRTSPLAALGREWDVAHAIAGALATARPRPDLIALEALSVGAVWPTALREQWPGTIKPPVHTYFVQGSPVAALEHRSFDDWLASRNAKVRRELTRRRRRFEDAGGIWRMCTADTLTQDVSAFMRLHVTRWQGRGGSSIARLGGRMQTMLEEIGAAHIDSGRLRLVVLELDRKPVSVQLAAAAGGEVLFVNAGWDESFGNLSPVTLGKMYALQDACARGDRRIDFAPGEQAFKLRLTDFNDPVAWSILVVPSSRLALTYARTAPMLVSRRLTDFGKRALSPERAEKARRLRARLRVAK